MATSADEWGGVVSPDLQWFAFVSDESGELEVYITQFPESIEKQKISAAKGRIFRQSTVRWAPDSRHLFYTQDERVVEVAISVNGNTVEPEKPRILPQQELLSLDSVRVRSKS